MELLFGTIKPIQLSPLILLISFKTAAPKWTSIDSPCSVTCGNGSKILTPKCTNHHGNITYPSHYCVKEEEWEQTRSNCSASIPCYGKIVLDFKISHWKLPYLQEITLLQEITFLCNRTTLRFDILFFVFFFFLEMCAKLCFLIHRILKFYEWLNVYFCKTTLNGGLQDANFSRAALIFWRINFL